MRISLSRKIIAVLILSLPFLMTCRSKMDPRYLSPGRPIVTSITPNAGVISGGDTVTITGTNFRAGLVSVTIGTFPCTITSTTPTQITCVTGRATRSNAYGVTVTAIDTLETHTLPAAFGYYAFFFSVAGSNLYEYKIDPLTGNLTNGASYGVGANAYGLAVHPSNNFVYVANPSGSIYGFSINTATGVLTTLAGSPYATAPLGGPDTVNYTSDGRFMFIGGTANPSGVSSYSIDAVTGLPTLVSSNVIATGCNFAGQLVVDATNQFIYMSCNAAGSGGAGSGLAWYNINTTTGAITFGGFIPNSGSGDAISIDLTNTYVYMGTTGTAGPVGTCGTDAAHYTHGGVAVFQLIGGVPFYLTNCTHGDDSGSAGTRGSGSSVDQTNRWLVTSSRTGGFAQIWDISGGIPAFSASYGAGAGVSAGTNDSRFDKTGRFMYTNTDGAGGTVDFFTFDYGTGIPTFSTSYSTPGAAGVSDVTY